MEEEKNLFSIKLKNRFNGNISLNYGINQYAETLADAYRHGNTRQSVIIEFQIPIFSGASTKIISGSQRIIMMQVGCE
ncbi:hypothetical protein ACIXLV_13860 [Bacteroides fragilis]